MVRNTQRKTTLPPLPQEHETIKTLHQYNVRDKTNKKIKAESRMVQIAYKLKYKIQQNRDITPLISFLFKIRSE